MTTNNRWLLPEGIDEVLPPMAGQLDNLCRRLIDLHASWGYELVIPPLIEYLDSLLTDKSKELDLQTFKITDQLTGRMMGVRADTTLQVARIDAHKLMRKIPTRLCYLGTVLHTRPANQGGTRAPLQMGAELYGHAEHESDAEILSLMLKSLQLSGLHKLHVDLGHAGIFRGLISKLTISQQQESVLFDVLQRKATTELHDIIKNWALSSDISDMLLGLIELNGGSEVLVAARALLANAGDDVLACIDDLERISQLTERQVKNAPLYFDLAELRGYHYETGMTFATYVSGQGQAIALGGRYNDIGSVFGQSRPATGYSTDVKVLFSLVSNLPDARTGIFAPNSEVPGLVEVIDEIRKRGETVICELPGQVGDASDMGCDRKLVLEGGKWVVREA